MSTTTASLPDGRTAVFTHRDVINRNRPGRAAYRAPAGLPKIELPIDWTKGNTLPFPILGNNRHGDCMYCAAVHMDQTFTGNVGTEAEYDEQSVIKHYLKLSPWDSGLGEDQISGEWHRGLCGNPDASILDSLDVDVTDDDLVNSAIYLFGGVFFMLSVPNAWINDSSTGAVWDAPARPNLRNGHGTCWNGVDTQNRKVLQTWGTHVLITPAGVKSCDPSGFVVFSKRWFDPKTGLAPNGFSYGQLAAYWESAGGSKLPASPFPDPLPPMHA